jgi:predicted MFS family arabinose efflux permease
LSILFGTVYFIQGIGAPDDGLMTQPVVSLLKAWEHSPAEITAFSALIAIPWSLKPLYGLLTDFVPLLGYRRRSYLIVNSAVTVACLMVLYHFPPKAGAYHRLLLLLLVPTMGVAFCDVVADALMVEKGQARGITGQLQAVQWSALYAANILTGFLGGYLSEQHKEHLSFLICGLVATATLFLAFVCVHESPTRASREGFHTGVRTLWQAAYSPTVLGIGGFLFLWSFNPFSTTVLYLHMTKELGFNEQFYGNSQSYIAVASLIASVSYGFYCRRLSPATLVHTSIVLGIASTLAYWAMTDELSAVLVSLVFGFTYGTANLILLDLAARACPPRTAGTVFALLMALSNFSVALSTWLGGWWYEQGLTLWGSRMAFQVLVGVGALCTAGCWLLWPLWLRHAVVRAQEAGPELAKLRTEATKPDLPEER